jgi:hypothetical protein
LTYFDGQKVKKGANPKKFAPGPNHEIDLSILS